MARHHNRHGAEKGRTKRFSALCKKRRDSAKTGSLRRRRSRGFSGIPQIVKHSTAARWDKQFCGWRLVEVSYGNKVRVPILGRGKKNEVVVIG